MRDIFILNQDLKYPVKAVNPFDKNVVGNKIRVKDMYFDIGGGASNTAATLANMGLKTGLLSMVGDDLAGREVLKIIRKFKIDTSLVDIDKKEETGYSVIFINKSGDRTTLTFRGAADFNRLKGIKEKKLNSNWFFITTLTGNLSLLKKIFKLAGKKKIKIAWNPGNAELTLGSARLKPLLSQCEVIFLNLQEAQTLAGDKTKNIKKLFNKLTKLAPNSIWCVTGAKKGAWVKERNEILWAGILDKKVVNATGAGDAFGSAFVAGLNIYAGNLKKSLQLAMLNSNSVVTEMGAKHGLLKKPPTKKMLDKIRIKKIK